MAHRAWAIFGQEHTPPFPTITITHSSISVYTCSVRVPQAHTPGTETVPGYNARGHEKICTRSVTNPLCTPLFVAQLTLQTSYILGFSSASAHKQSHYWPDATREGRRRGACEAGSRQRASEIWCLWCEHGAFDPLFNKDTSTQWKSDLLVRSRGLQVRVPAHAAVCLPGLTEVVPLDAHLEPLDGVWASPKRHLAEMPTLMAEGFDGWWEPMQYTVGWFTWDGQDIPIIIPAVWD